MQRDPIRGLGQSPNGGLGGQSPPTAKPSDNLRFRCNYCARIMCMLFTKLMHTHQYLLIEWYELLDKLVKILPHFSNEALWNDSWKSDEFLLMN